MMTSLRPHATCNCRGVKACILHKNLLRSGLGLNGIEWPKRFASLNCMLVLTWSRSKILSEVDDKVQGRTSALGC